MRAYVLKASFHVDQNFVFGDLEMLLEYLRQDLIDAEADSDYAYQIDVVEMTQEEIDALPVH